MQLKCSFWTFNNVSLHFRCFSEWQNGYIDFLYCNVISLWFLLCAGRFWTFWLLCHNDSPVKNVNFGLLTHSDSPVKNIRKFSYEILQVVFVFFFMFRIFIFRILPYVLQYFSASRIPQFTRSRLSAFRNPHFTVIHHSYTRVLTNLAKCNSLSFPGFPDPLNSLFQTIIK